MEIDKLSDKAISAAKPKSNGKVKKLSDGAGLFLWVMPNGSKYWRFKYYNLLGKERSLSIGVYPTVTLKAARNAAKEARQALLNGIDPSQQKQDEKRKRKQAADNSFQSIALEWLEKRKRDGLASVTREKNKWLLEKKLFPFIGGLPVSEVTAADLLKALRQMEVEGLNESARRARSVAGQVIRYAVVTSRAERDPTQDLRGALVSAKVKHRAAITDPSELGKLLVAMDAYTGTPETKAAMLLHPLLFQRPGEIRQMKWEDVDLENAEWRYLVTKTNTPHIVPLCKQALAILKDLYPLTGHGCYVFPSARGGSRPLSENGVRTALRTMGYTNEQVTPHGFRATARTLLDEKLGVSVDLIEHQSARTVRDAMGTAYNRTKHLEARKEMMQQWGDYLDTLRAIARGENVIHMLS